MMQSDVKAVAIVVTMHIVIEDILALVLHIFCRSYCVFVPRIL